MKIKTTNINWDTDEHKVDLPQQVELEVDHEDEIADKLSDIYGWCIYGLNYEMFEAAEAVGNVVDGEIYDFGPEC